MSTKSLYEQIVESIRDDIYAGRLRPDDPLPTVRELADQWQCAPGTVQRAYHALSEGGLIISVTGRGTRVAPQAADDRLRAVRLVTEIEMRLLDLLNAGYSLPQLESALWVAVDHLREQQQRVSNRPQRLHFVGSHDPALSLVSGLVAADFPIEMTFAGSLNGLLQLASGQADFAGCHLWDSVTGLYNIAHIQRLLAGREVAVMTIAHRQLGLITVPDDTHSIASLADLTRAGVRFINRQSGAGTRLWLDEQLAREGIDPAMITGYEHEATTHVAVAQAVATGAADAAIGVEAAARVFGLRFVPLTTERYDLVIPEETWDSAVLQALVGCLQLESTRRAIYDLGGYDTSDTGTLAWVH